MFDCVSEDERVDVNQVISYVASKSSAWLNASNCSLPPGVNSLADLRDSGGKPAVFVVGRLFYGWFTPMVLLVGLIGNTLSLCVFVSRNMRSLSASTYLAALSTADLTALVFYVLVEWLIRGLPALQGEEEDNTSLMATNGSCQMVMYLHYVSRFLSAWIVVAFTVER